MNDMNNMESWYSPLKPQEVKAEEKKTEAKKKKKLSKKWKAAIALFTVVALIVVSSLAFSGSEKKSAAMFPDYEMPDNSEDFFEDYFTPADSSAEINVEKASDVSAFTLTLKDEADEELSLGEIYESCAKSTVAIMGYTNGVEGFFWGSGIILSHDGLVLTNSHVLEGCDSATVTLCDDSVYDAYLVGADSISDIAVLKINATGLPAASFGDSAKLSVGDKVAAIGNPLGETFRMTLTDGIVSAIERGITYNGHVMTLIQTNTALNEGNSGGALFNMYGQVVGVTNMKMMSTYSSIEGIGFAIPSSTVKSVVNSIIKYGEVRGRPAVGITVGSIPDNAASAYGLPFGLYVTGVSKGSDAEYKGIQSGDIVIAVNGKEARVTEDIVNVKNSLDVGDSITFTIWRDGQTFDVEVVLVDSNDIY